MRGLLRLVVPAAPKMGHTLCDVTCTDCIFDMRQAGIWPAKRVATVGVSKKDKERHIAWAD